VGSTTFARSLKPDFAMHLRPAFDSAIRSLLYWAVFALATGGAAAQDLRNGAGPDAAGAAGPHIAVILPLQSTAFGRHADSVRLGILAAAAAGQGPGNKVYVYATTEDPQQIVAAYQRATSYGARVVIGPLTRDGVTFLAHSGIVSVPTLALNQPEGEMILPRNLYVFGLQLEAEARQVAQLAHRQKNRSIFVVNGDSPLDARIAQAFLSEWSALKGEVAGQFSYTTDAAGLAKLRDQLAASRADAVFLTIGATRARFVRSYLGSNVAVYATSQVLASATDTLANFDLEGVRFLDMPWLLQPDHPAVLSYLRSDPPLAALDQERFYALGIDAYRIAQELLHPYRTQEALDGVTGTVTLGDDQQFTRVLVPAQFSQGSPQALAAP
jgi:outer membrane PBP1 activator LpoA protein